MPTAKVHYSKLLPTPGNRHLLLLLPCLQQHRQPLLWRHLLLLLLRRERSGSSIGPVHPRVHSHWEHER